MDFVTNIISDSVSGFVDSGMRAAGGYAGDTLNKFGDYIESAGASYSNAVQGKFDGWGNSVRGVGPAPTANRSLPRTKTITGASATPRPKAVQRSISSPPSSKPKTSTAVAKKPTTTAVKAGPKATGTSVSRTQSKPAKKSQTAAKLAGSKSQDKIKFTPGVVTGLPQQKQLRGKSGVKTDKGNTRAGESLNYTPGVVTGLPKSTTAKAKEGPKPIGASAKAAGNAKGGGEIKFTPGKITGMPKKASVKA